MKINSTSINSCLLGVFSILIFTGSCMASPEPIAYYSFDNATNMGCDSSGNNLHGRDSGARYLAEGIVNGAAYFAGNGERITVSHNELLNLTNFTLTFFLKTPDSSSPSGQNRIMGKYSTTEPGGWCTYITSYSGVILSAGAGAENTVKLMDVKNTGRTEWTHIAMVFSSSYCATYTNGILAVSTNWNSDVYLNSSYDLEIGGYGSTYFLGWIDEVKIWNGVLNKNQIKHESNRGFWRSNIVETIFLDKNGRIPLPNTDLVYYGSGQIEIITGNIADALTNYPWSNVSLPLETVLVKISKIGSSCSIKPAGMRSADILALIIEGDPKNIQVDFGQATGAGLIPYMFVDGNAGKVLFKGMGDNVGRLVINNETDRKGVHLKNISKGNGGFIDIITMGKLRRVHSSHAGIGRADAVDSGIIMIGKDSPKGQIKVNPKSGIANVLICRNVDTNIFADFQTAYAACISSNEVLPGIEPVRLKMINTKAVGPALIAASLDNKYKDKLAGKRITITDPVVYVENIIK